MATAKKRTTRRPSGIQDDYDQFESYMFATEGRTGRGSRNPGRVYRGFATVANIPKAKVKQMRPAGKPVKPARKATPKPSRPASVLFKKSPPTSVKERAAKLGRVTRSKTSAMKNYNDPVYYAPRNSRGNSGGGGVRGRRGGGMTWKGR